MDVEMEIYGHASKQTFLPRKATFGSFPGSPKQIASALISDFKNPSQWISLSVNPFHPCPKIASEHSHLDDLPASKARVRL